MRNAEYQKFKKLVEGKFNFDTSGLTAYIDQERRELITKFQTTKGIMDYAFLEDAVKGSRDLHFLDTTTTFQSDADCGYNASDTTSLTKRTLTVGHVKREEDICPKKLKAFWTEILMRKGASGDEIIPNEINSAWMNLVINQVANALAVADWRGDTDSATANLNKYEGLLKQLNADSDVIEGNPDGYSEVTLGNVLDVMQTMYLQVTEDMHDAGDVESLDWFLPRDIYNKYIIAARNANLYHHNVTDEQPTYHGTKIPLIIQAGLQAGNEMVITPRRNLGIAVDDRADEERLDVWYSKDDRINHSTLHFSRGTTYKYGSRVVLFDASYS